MGNLDMQSSTTNPAVSVSGKNALRKHHIFRMINVGLRELRRLWAAPTPFTPAHRLKYYIFVH
jgi:hypothetical protein